MLDLYGNLLLSILAKLHASAYIVNVFCVGDILHEQRLCNQSVVITIFSVETYSQNVNRTWLLTMRYVF